MFVQNITKLSAAVHELSWSQRRKTRKNTIQSVADSDNNEWIAAGLAGVRKTCVCGITLTCVWRQGAACSCGIQSAAICSVTPVVLTGTASHRRWRSPTTTRRTTSYNHPYTDTSSAALTKPALKKSPTSILNKSKKSGDELLTKRAKLLRGLPHEQRLRRLNLPH